MIRIPLAYGKYSPSIDQKPEAVRRVLLLAPSRGLGGGIERYVETLEWAFSAKGVCSHRIDLRRSGTRAHLKMMADSRAVLRDNSKPISVLVGHRALLPVATLVAHDPMVRGLFLLCHGNEVWGPRRPRSRFERRLMQRAGVNVVAVSSFTAGALAPHCQATVLPPALSEDWFHMLAAAGDAERQSPREFQLVTAFRLGSWREKGLPELIDAVARLRRPDVRLTICGSGDAPRDLVRLVESKSWCVLAVHMNDRDLARTFATADLFVLATRTRFGRSASGEGFGMVLLEAQVAGTAVIAPAYGGSADAYIDGVTGMAPVDESAEALALVLGRLLDDRARLTWMGTRASEWARESFAPELYAQLVVDKLLCRTRH